MQMSSKNLISVTRPITLLNEANKYIRGYLVLTLRSKYFCLLNERLSDILS